MEITKDLENIKKIVRLAYVSAFLPDEKPLSIILLAPPEQSKTHYVLKYKTKHSHIATDLSYKGLIDILTDNKKVKHLVIPDFLKLTEKNQSTKKNLISALNSFIEEGIFQVNLANKETIDFKGRRGAIITSTTKESFKQNAKNWSSMGFKSRFLPVSWEFSQETKEKVMEQIVQEKDNNQQKPENISLKQNTIEVNEEVKKELISLSDGSPRRFKNLKVLLKALTLEKGKNYSDSEDIEELKELNKYININFNKI